MKYRLLLLLILFSHPLFALDFEKMTYVVGRFGVDTATTKSKPGEFSETTARMIWNTLNVQPDSWGEKFIGEIIDGEQFGFVCRHKTPYRLGKPLYQCGFNVLVNIESKKDESSHGVPFDFPPKMSKNIYQALSLPEILNKEGRFQKEVGDLVCSRPSNSSDESLYRCRVKISSVHSFPAASYYWDEEARLYKIYYATILSQELSKSFCADQLTLTPRSSK